MIIEAKIQDATHLVLSQPLDGEVGTKIFLEITNQEREDFLSQASSDLERAYGNDEPDYSGAGVPLSL